MSRAHDNFLYEQEIDYQRLRGAGVLGTFPTPPRDPREVRCTNPGCPITYHVPSDDPRCCPGHARAR